MSSSSPRGWAMNCADMVDVEGAMVKIFVDLDEHFLKKRENENERNDNEPNVSKHEQ